MLECIKRMRGKGRRSVPKNHPWKVKGTISPSRKKLGIADYEAVRGDSVAHHQKKIGIRGRFKK